MFKKLLNNIYNKIKEHRKGGIISKTFFTIIVSVLSVWFFCACHGWLILAFPAFYIFPKWAFVLLMFILSSGSRERMSSFAKYI